MTTLSVGDLARSFQLRRHHDQAKADLARLTQELSSGQRANMGKALRGDFTALSGLERGLRMAGAYASASAEAAMVTAASQAALEAFQSTLDEMGPDLLSATGTGSLQQMDLMAASAPDRLETMVATLNQTVAGRSLFSGAASATDALIPAAQIMAALTPLAAGATDAADLVATLESWFMATGGGFETMAYQGNASPPPAFAVADGETVGNPATALDPGLRRGMMGMALAGLVASDAVSFSAADKQTLLKQAALDMTAASGDVTDLRASVGHAEARIEAAQTRATTTTSMLQLERNRLTAADPYTTATELQEAETRLQSLYLLTTRLSRLSLTEYL